MSRLESLMLGTRPRTKAPVSFLFVGATGTGKGELASVIGEVMGRNVAKFNMSEYNNDNTLWTLLGSPKGHVNTEEGLLTRTVRNDPNTILFFDEIEKGKGTAPGSRWTKMWSGISSAGRIPNMAPETYARVSKSWWSPPCETH